MKATLMHEAYRSLINGLYHRSYYEVNARTGVGISVLRGGQSFKLNLSRGKLPVPGNRRYFPHIAATEVAWQFMGTKDPSWIVKHAPKLWSKFVEDGELKAAYGYRWKHHFGRDQLGLMIQALRDDPTNRQLFISSWDPATDGLGSPNQPMNIPCPVGFSVTAGDGALHMSVFVRSSDVFVGLPYDVMSYALTLDAISMSVGIKPGTLHFTLAHAHSYEPHAQMIEDCIFDSSPGRSGWITDCEPRLPGWSVEMIEADPDGYRNHVKTLAGFVKQHEWNPLPEVVV